MMGTTSGKLWGRFNDAPLVVQAYLVFAVIASILSLSGIVSQPLNQALVPYMGWSGLSLYMFTLYFTIGPVFSSSPLLRWTIFLNVFMLGVFVVIGSREMIQHLSAPNRDFGNPYLTYHVWRPAFTIALPATWALLFLSPSVWRWVRNRPRDEVQSRRYQFSLVDLLFVMLTVCVTMAISVQLVALVRRHQELPAAVVAISEVHKYGTNLHGLPIPTRRASQGNSSFGRSSRSRVGFVSASCRLAFRNL